MIILIFNNKYKHVTLDPKGISVADNQWISYNVILALTMLLFLNFLRFNEFHFYFVPGKYTYTYLTILCNRCCEYVNSVQTTGLVSGTRSSPLAQTTGLSRVTLNANTYSIIIIFLYFINKSFPSNKVSIATCVIRI